MYLHSNQRVHPQIYDGVVARSPASAVRGRRWTPAQDQLSLAAGT